MLASSVQKMPDVAIWRAGTSNRAEQIRPTEIGLKRRRDRTVPRPQWAGRGHIDVGKESVQRGCRQTDRMGERSMVVNLELDHGLTLAPYIISHR